MKIIQWCFVLIFVWINKYKENYNESLLISKCISAVIEGYTKPSWTFIQTNIVWLDFLVMSPPPLNIWYWPIILSNLPLRFVTLFCHLLMKNQEKAEHTKPIMCLYFTENEVLLHRCYNTQLRSLKYYYSIRCRYSTQFCAGPLLEHLGSPQRWKLRKTQGTVCPEPWWQTSTHLQLHQTPPHLVSFLWSTWSQ